VPCFGTTRDARQSGALSAVRAGWSPRKAVDTSIAVLEEAKIARDIRELRIRERDEYVLHREDDEEYFMEEYGEHDHGHGHWLDDPWERTKPVIPFILSSFQRSVLGVVHGSPVGGHIGRYSDVSRTAITSLRSSARSV
jgi:hypothetical protein